MWHSIVRNFNILKNAVGVEPSSQIVMNAIRKIVGLPPQHQEGVYVGTPKDLLDPAAESYSQYLIQQDEKLKLKVDSFDYDTTIDIIWILGDEKHFDINSTYQSLLQQYATPEHIFIVSNETLPREIRSKCRLFASIKEAMDVSAADYVSFLHGTPRVHSAYVQELMFCSVKYSGANLFYTCDDILLEDGTRVDPRFKPELNQFLLYSSNYIGRNITVKRDLGHRMGWFDTSFMSAYIYDFILRCIEQKVKFHRVEQVLISHQEKEIVEDLGERKRALTNHLRRQGDFAQVTDGLAASTTRLQRSISNDKVVSIIIPFKDQVALLKQCMNSILEQTEYKNYEIILVDNASAESPTFDYFIELKNRHDFIRLLHIDAPFNFSYLNNEAVKVSRGDYLLFLNNDTKVITKGWLKAMVQLIENKEVGVVGAKLLYEDNTVQHAGVILGVGHIAGHAFRNSLDIDEGSRLRTNSTQEYLAVTGACLLTKKELFEQVKGFDEENLKIAYNDVDYCLKIHDMGYKVVYTPYAKLYHFESKSRASDLASEQINRYQKECSYMRSKWEDKYFVDPYFHPHLDNRYEDFRVA